jgi:hypothetical protein
MKYTISINRHGWMWLWDVADGNGFHISDYSLTKRGAIWTANRQAKKWARDRFDSLTKESWEVEY